VVETSADFVARSNFQQVFRDMDTLRAKTASTTAAVTASGAAGLSAGAKFQRGMLNAGGAMTAFSGQARAVGSTLNRSLTLPIVALGAGALVAAISFESAFTGIRKTVNATEAEFAELEVGIRQMAKEIPTSANELAKIGEVAGQLGVEAGSLLEFTRVVADLAETTNIVGEEGALALAQFMNVMQTAEGDIDKIGSTIVDLGNNSATTEADILKMAQRLASIGPIVGLSEAEVLSMAAAFSSVGLAAESGGTAITRTMITMAESVNAGGEELELFAAVAGTTTDEFAMRFETDAVGALDQFIQGLASLDAAGGDVFAVLDELGLDAIRVRDALLLASNAGDLLPDAIERGNAAWEANNALTKEADLRYKTTAARLEIMKNKFVDAGIGLGQALLPFLEILVGFLTDHVIPAIETLVGWFSSLDPTLQKIILGVILFLAVMGPIASIIGAVIGVLGALSTAIGGIGIALSFLLAHPVILAIVAVIILIAALAFLIIKNWDKIGPFLSDLWDTVKQIFGAAWDFIKDVVEAGVKFVASIILAYIDIWITIITTGWDVIKAVFEFAWKVISAIVTGAVAVIAAIVTGFVDVVVAIFTTAWDIIAAIFQAAWDSIKVIVIPALMLIQATIEVVMAIIVGIFKVQWAIISLFIRVTMDAIRLIIETVWGFIGGFVLSVMNGIKAVVIAAWGVVKAITGVVMGVIKAVVVTTFNIVKAQITQALNIVKAAFRVFKTVAVTVWNGVKAVITGVVNTIKTVIGSIVGVIDRVKNAFGGFLTKVGSVMRGIRDKVKSAVDATTGFLNRLNPFSRGSPSLVQNVERGTEKITDQFGMLSSIEIDGPTIRANLLRKSLTAGISAASRVQDVRIVGQPIAVTGMGGGGGGGGVGLGSSLGDLGRSIVGAIGPEGELLTDVLNRYLQQIADDGDFLNDWLTHMPQWMRDAAEPLGIRLAKISDQLSPVEKEALGNYLRLLVEDGAAQGDFLNDFLTHLPEEMRAPVQAIGEQLANMLDGVALIAESVSGGGGGGGGGDEAEGGSLAARVRDLVDARVPDESAVPDPMTGMARNASGRMLRLLANQQPALPAAPPPDDGLFKRIANAGGAVSYVVNNPKAEETEDSLRKIGMRRTYLGANAGDPEALRRTTSARNARRRLGSTRRDLIDSGARSGRFKVN